MADIQVYIDGGCRRGTDVIKALCLGAKGVGMGRPFLYALTYGGEGVVHAIESEFRVPSPMRPVGRVGEVRGLSRRGVRV